MNLRNKKHIIIPVAIVIYTIVLAIYAATKNYPSQDKTSYYIVIVVSLLLAFVLYLVLKKREDFRNKNKK